MKRQYGKIMQRLAALTLGVFLIASPMAQAAVNTAIGDVNDVGADLADSNPFTLTRSTPTLIKAAFLTSDNTPLTSGDVLPAGTSVDFLIYLNNVAGIDILDVGIQDTLVGFTYLAGTIRVRNTTTCAGDPCLAAEEQTIYDDARATGALSDTPNNDAASLNVATVEVGNNGIDTGNAQQNAVANTVLAVVFTAILD